MKAQFYKQNIKKLQDNISFNNGVNGENIVTYYDESGNLTTKVFPKEQFSEAITFLNQSKVSPILDKLAVQDSSNQYSNFNTFVNSFDKGGKTSSLTNYLHHNNVYTNELLRTSKSWGNTNKKLRAKFALFPKYKHGSK